MSTSSCRTSATCATAASTRSSSRARSRGPRRWAAVPLREVDCDKVIATKLTLGLIKSQARRARAHYVDAAGGGRDREADPGRLVHAGLRPRGALDSDCVAIVLETAAGRVVHTGDWKLDHTPVDGLKTDVGRLAEPGNLRRRDSDARRLDERRGPGMTDPSGSSAKRFARRSRCAGAGSSSSRSPRTSTGCSRRSTSRSRSAGRSPSSGVRCARTSTSRASSATSRCRSTF